MLSTILPHSYPLRVDSAIMPSATRTRTTAPSELLHYLPAYRVLVCKECRYAIQPSAISRHLKDLHHIYRLDRQQLLESTQSLDLADPAHMVLPAPHDAPVSLLPTENGLACAANECNHLCVTVKRMKNHWAAAHKDLVRAEAAQWHPVTLQTFFRGNQLRYFRVKLEHIPVPLKPALEGFVEEIAVKPPPSTWSANDIALYNQFIDSTNHTLTPYPNSKKLWQTAIPQMAYEHDFLKYGIFACSALHLAYLTPSHRQQYQMIAAAYQDQALHLFRAAIASLKDSNCNALLAFSQLLVVHCFAFEEQDEGLLFVKRKHDLGLPEWLQIIRSSCTMFSVVCVLCFPFSLSEYLPELLYVGANIILETLIGECVGPADSCKRNPSTPHRGESASRELRSVTRSRSREPLHQAVL